MLDTLEAKFLRKLVKGSEKLDMHVVFVVLYF